MNKPTNMQEWSALYAEAIEKFPPEGRCPVCNHWPYTGQHGEQGCGATAGTAYPCGCTHEAK